MKSVLRIILLLTGFLPASFVSAQNNKPKDYLSVPGPLSLSGVAYNLSWTAHPNENYYKQEYLPAKENPDRYKKMLMLEALVGNNTAAELANAKVNELKELKLHNPVVNYEIFQKNGEYLLDFLISDNGPGGSINIIEHNVYRYKGGIDNSGKSYVMLFAISERAYGNDSDKFLLTLKKTKAALQNAVAAYPLPVITVKN